MISVEHLTKCYGGFKAVDDLSFEIDEGHVYGFLGPNGAGKSTTMNIMTGCLSATEGSVKIDGYDIFEDAGKAKKLIGYLPEQPPLYMNETPMEYLRFVGEAKGLHGAELESQIEEVIRQTKIGDVKGRRISSLSKGYKQRVGIAQALLGNPRVIVLDEPTVGLDPMQIIEIRALIKELGQTHTVIFSSHILSEVQTICDRILIISKGRLVAFDEPENLEKRLLAPNEITITADSSQQEIREILSSVKNISDVRIEARDERFVQAHIKTDFTEQYTNETVQNNSLIVECGDRSRFIGYDDIYIQEADVYSYSYNTSFDGEGAITSAIDYVVSEELPQLYMLEGHGEAELPATFSEQIEKENIEVSSFSLLTVDSVPEEADCVLIYAPTSDISEEEQKMLANYVTDGGKLLVMAGPTEEGTLKNLYGLLEAYGVEASDGVVIEADREHYAFQAPYVLLPDMAGSDITDSLIEENYFPIMPISQGMKITGSSGNGTVTELLTTSDAAFSKIAGYSLSTYEKEEDDIDGPFSVALSVEANSGGKIVWFASSSFLEDMYNAYSSGANGDMAMNALSSLVGESEAMAIRSKSLNYNYLTISASTSSLLKVMMIGVFPLLYLGIGICVVLTRRKKQNETV